ncbi:MAG: polyketide synthase dehydratase domain-containing protein, partial [Myxococcales bacterium]|nr:polyketide synthase dehydratase domain-containing protein [Myxococcales bacterium]
PALAEALADLRPGPTRVPMISTVTGAALDPQQLALDGAYWCRNLRQVVRFAAAVEVLLGDCDALLEISARPVLANPLARLATDTTLVLRSLDGEQGDGMATIAEGLATLHCAGLALDWARILAAQPRVALPTYPWQHQSYWIDDAPTQRREGHPLLGEGASTSLLPEARLWPMRIDLQAQPAFADHRVAGRVVLPGAAILDLFAAAGEQLRPDLELALTQLRFLAPVLLPDPDHDGSTVWIGELIATPSDDGRGRGQSHRLRLLGRDDEGRWIEHAAALLHLDDGEGDDAPAPALDRAALDPLGDDGFERDCPEPLPPATLAAGRARRGLVIGPAFSCLESLHLGPGRASAALGLAPRQALASHGHRLDPMLLDAALNLAGVVHGPGADEGESGGEDNDDPWLLTAIDRLRWRGRLGRRARARALAIGEASPRERGARVLLRDDDDREQAWIAVEGVTTRRVPR